MYHDMKTMIVSNLNMNIAAHLTLWHNFFNERIAATKQDSFVYFELIQLKKLKMDTMEIIKSKLNHYDCSYFHNHVVNSILYSINDTTFTDFHRRSFGCAEAISDDGKKIIRSFLDIFIDENYSTEGADFDHLRLYLHHLLIVLFESWRISDYITYFRYIAEIDKITNMRFVPESTFAFSDYLNHLICNLHNSRNLQLITDLLHYVKDIFNINSKLSKVNQTVPTINQTVPTTNQTVSTTNQTIHTTNQTVPNSNQTVPTTNQTIPTTNQTIHTANQTVPNSNQTVPTTNQTIPTTNQTIHTTNQTVPNSNQTVLNPNQTIPITNQTVLNPNQTVLNPNQTVLNPNQTVLNPNQTIEEFEYLVIKLENDIRSGKYIGRQSGNIPAPLRQLVWSEFASNIFMKSKCFCCRNSDISISNFDCGHIISRKANGPITIENLRPICGQCNNSMGAENMCSYIKRFGFWNQNPNSFPSQVTSESSPITSDLSLVTSGSLPITSVSLPVTSGSLPIISVNQNQERLLEQLRNYKLPILRQLCYCFGILPSNTRNETINRMIKSGLTSDIIIDEITSHKTEKYFNKCSSPRNDFHVGYSSIKMENQCCNHCNTPISSRHNEFQIN